MEALNSQIVERVYIHNMNTDDSAIGCDRCDTWFHCSEMCLGLPGDVFSCLSRYGGEGIVLFVQLVAPRQKSIQLLEFPQKLFLSCFKQ